LRTPSEILERKTLAEKNIKMTSENTCENTCETRMDTPTLAPDPSPDLTKTEKTRMNKQPRSESQIAALARARARAIEVRRFKSEQAWERKESDKNLPTREEMLEWEAEKEEKKRMAEGSQSPKQSPKKKRKPARRVIVTEVSSGSDSDVEVVLPRVAKQKPLSESEIQYRHTESKMFSYQ
jgi:hypothetical protein